MLAHQLGEGVDHEGVVLARDAKDAARRSTVLVLGFEEGGLLDDLPRVREEPRAILGGHNALAGTLEDGDAHLGLELGDGLGERRLRDEEPLRRGGDRACRGDLDHVTKLLQCHAVLLPQGGASGAAHVERCYPTIRVRTGKLCPWRKEHTFPSSGIGAHMGTGPARACVTWLGPHEEGVTGVLFENKGSRQRSWERKQTLALLASGVRVSFCHSAPGWPRKKYPTCPLFD